MSLYFFFHYGTVTLERKQLVETNATDKDQSSQDPIKIYDNEFDEISYNSLSLNEKQKVLSELLFQSALKNIANFRLVMRSYFFIAIQII
jgi:hypothetical protein